jgi:GNAT superfamily N-acetyltransferase
MGLEIVRAWPERASDLADLLADAFVDDAIIAWPFGGPDPERTRTLFELLNAELARDGMVWEVAPARGVAAWVPPDGFERYVEVDALLRDRIRELMPDAADRYWAMWDRIESHLPEEPQWFLDHVAVAERERGTGLGAALVRFGLERAASDGVPATLETSRPETLLFYEHLGFRVYLEDDVPDGGPHLWFMRADG